MYRAVFNSKLGSLFLFLLFCLCAPIFADKKYITILSFNDVYQIVPKQGRGGFAELFTLIERERETAPQSILTVNGDFLFPSLLSLLSQGAHVISLFNDMGVDFVTFGNHEFDFGSEVLRKRIAESNFIWLGTNVRERNGAIFANVADTYVREVDGVKVGFFGLCTEDTKTISKGGDDVIFDSIIRATRRAIEQLEKQGAHIIVAITHLSFDQDKQLARLFPKISLILGGHEHNVITWQEGTTLIHKSGQDANYLAVFQLAVDEVSLDMSTQINCYSQWSMKGVWDLPAHPQLKAKIDALEDSLNEKLLFPVCTLNESLDSRSTFLRSRETSMGDLITDAMREHLKADVAIINGGAIRGNRLYEKGSIVTIKDIYNETPFANTCVLVKMKGSVLRRVLEHGLALIDIPDGRFSQFSGAKVIYTKREDQGVSIEKITVGANKLKDNEEYLVATIDHLLNGGDGYSLFKDTEIVLDTSQGPLLTLVILEYLSQGREMNFGNRLVNAVAENEL